MKRDMDLVRELLLKLEAIPLPAGAVMSIHPYDDEVAVEGFAEDQIDYHLRQIRATGWIDTGGSQPLMGISFRCLTPAGHDFLDSVRDPEIWRKTKGGAVSAGGFTLDLLKDLAKGFLKTQIEQRTGIKL